MWNGLKVSPLDATEAVCGRTKGLARFKETWWWNKEVSKAIDKKKRAFLAWRKSDLAADKNFYNKAKRDARCIIAAVQAGKRQEFSDNLRSAETKSKLFTVVKQMVRKNRDVVGGSCIKNKEQTILTEEKEIKEVWKEYYHKLLNEEFEWGEMH